jgi:monoamine oxidase
LQLGLNVSGLDDDEYGLLPKGADVEAYARVRNAVLGLWRRNVCKMLTLEDAMLQFQDRDKPYALAAWHFLNTMGYINFGTSKTLQRELASTRDDQGTVIVVGAGCAGLAAARQLRMRGYRVVVVEGRKRPGGRVHTVKMTPPIPNLSEGVSADLGGSIITGMDGNPLAIIANQLGLPLYRIRSYTPLYLPDGSKANDDLDTLIERHFNFLEARCNDLRKNPDDALLMTLEMALESMWKKYYDGKKKEVEEESLLMKQLPEAVKGADGGLDDPTTAARQLFDWHLANLEFANASELSNISLVHWDQDDYYDMGGAHCFVPGGNIRWVKALCEGLTIFYDSPVSEIRYAKSGVALHTPERVFVADAVVVTVPLGVLKRGEESIRFSPPLPRRKLEAIDRLGFGVLNKVIFYFPYVFWDSENCDMFGHVASGIAERGEAFLFYSYAHISGGAQLTALIAGTAAKKHEQRSPSDAAARVLAILRRIFSDVPTPLQVVCTNWASDPMAGGSYSSLPRDCLGGKDYDRLAESVSGRVFFAGEATCRKWPATMHGAFSSGLVAAANVAATLKKEKHEKKEKAKEKVEKEKIEKEKMEKEKIEKEKIEKEKIEKVKVERETEMEERIAKTQRREAVLTFDASAPLQQPTSSVITQHQQQHVSPEPPAMQHKQQQHVEQANQPSQTRDAKLSVSSLENPATSDDVISVPPHILATSSSPQEAKIHYNLLTSARLTMLFDDPRHRPDLEFGVFSVILGPSVGHDSNIKDKALVRVMLDAHNTKNRQFLDPPPVSLYCVIPTTAALALAERPGDAARFSFLRRIPDGDLMKRTTLQEEVYVFLDAILNRRLRDLAQSEGKCKQQFGG